MGEARVREPKGRGAADWAAMPKRANHHVSLEDQPFRQIEAVHFARAEYSVPETKEMAFRIEFFGIRA